MARKSKADDFIEEMKKEKEEGHESETVHKEDEVGIEIKETAPEDVVFEVTKETKKKLEDELDLLIHKKRPEIAEALKEARSHGDLSENAEYDAARDAQAEVESKIMDIEYKLNHIKVISHRSNIDKVRLGLKVKIRNVEHKKTMDITIVSAIEADPPEKLSEHSPIGKALIGLGKGEKTKVVLPNGKEYTYKVLDIMQG